MSKTLWFCWSQEIHGSFNVSYHDSGTVLLLFGNDPFYERVRKFFFKLLFECTEYLVVCKNWLNTSLLKPATGVV